MAGATLAVNAVVSKLNALQQDLPSGLLRHAAAIVAELRATERAVAKVAAAENRDERASGSDLAGAFRLLDGLLLKLDPKAATGYCPTKLRELCYDAEDFADAFVAAAGEPQQRGFVRRTKDSMAMSAARRRFAAAFHELRLRAAAAASSVAEEEPRRRGGPQASRAWTMVPVDPRGDGYDAFAKRVLRGAVVEEGKRKGEERHVAGQEVFAIVDPAGLGKMKLAHEVVRKIVSGLLAHKPCERTVEEDTKAQLLRSSALPQGLFAVPKRVSAELPVQS